jgi:hypothetical protein
MGRLALAFAFGAMIAVGLPSPGLFVALGLGLAAVGCGLARVTRRDLPGAARLAGAAAVTVGALGVVLGATRVVLTLAAIDHLDRLLP